MAANLKTEIKVKSIVFSRHFLRKTIKKVGKRNKDLILQKLILIIEKID